MNLQDWKDLLFSYDFPKKYKWFFWLVIVILFLGGMALWGVFLDWVRSPLNYHDWADITLPRLAFLRDAIRKGLLPLHISDSLPLATATDRFMAAPDVLLSPQVILLAVMDIYSFILLNTWLLYTLGFVGILWLQKKLRLSLTAFTLLLILLNYNGHILAHYTVGHFTWGAYFLYPWFAGLIFELLEKGGSWRWTLKIALLMFFIFLNGGYHHFIWALIFMVFLAVFRLRCFWSLLKAAVFSVVLSAVRILPLLLSLKRFDTNFIGGYPLILSIWQSLAYTQIPNDITLNSGMTRPIGLWEFTLYVGFAGALFLLYFGCYRVLNQKHYEVLLIPVVGLVILSLGKVYQYLRLAIPLPLLTGERVASRMIILSFVFVVILAVIHLQQSLDDPHTSAVTRALWLAAGVLISNDLWQNFRLWRIRDASQAFPVKPFDPSRFTVNNYPDAPYFTLLWVGLALTLAGLAALIYLSRRENVTSKKPMPPDSPT